MHIVGASSRLLIQIIFELWPTPMNSRVPDDVDEAAARFDATIVEMMRRHDEVEAVPVRERTDRCGRALMADDPDASKLFAAADAASVHFFQKPLVRALS